MTSPKQTTDTKSPDSLDGHRILILTGEHVGEEGICLGKIAGTNRWAVSPDSSTAILELHFEDEFALLLNLSKGPKPAKRSGHFKGDHMQITELTSNAPLEVPSWHLELPLRWPQLTSAKPATFRLYPADHPVAIPTKKRAPTLPAKAKRKRKARKRRRT